MSLVQTKEKIESLHRPYQIQILRILKKHSVDFNENRNGVFFNLAKLDEATIADIDKYLSYVDQQINFLSEHEKQKDLYKENYFKNVDHNITINKDFIL
jgi:proline dehydrogenase